MNLQSASLLSSAEKYRRSSNFTIKEVKCLIQLVDSRKEIIESKKSDRTTSEEKVKAWKEIEKEFNAYFDEYRSFRVLKTKYDNLKKIIRRKFPSSSLSNLAVLKMMKLSENPVISEPGLDFDFSEDEKTFENSTISDVDMKPTMQLNEEELDAAAEEYVFETLLFGEAQTSQNVQQKTNFLKTPEEKSEKTQKKKNVTTVVDVWEEVAHKKLEKLELEIKVIEEEWALRKQKLELEVENVRIENRLKKELLREKLENNNSS